mgnify:CR=1 FL=1
MNENETSEFNYLINKISNAPFLDQPFRHIEIQDFLSPSHFEKIVTSPEIRLEESHSSKELLESLKESGYTSIKFPGTTTCAKSYLAWEAGQGDYDNVDTCEGFGMVFRLQHAKTSIITRLNEFLASPLFLTALTEKFDIERRAVFHDVGIQKYLDGYEISPHPDIRKKALTFMVNINTASDSHLKNYHTRYMKFIDSRNYVGEFWRHNEKFDRSWVPWNWCEEVKQQKQNNSIVIFRPNYDTIHAVKADYDHLLSQRTQLYGNLWYGDRKSSDVRDSEIVSLPQIPWQGLDIDERRGVNQKRTTARKPYSLKRRITNLINKLK